MIRVIQTQFIQHCHGERYFIDDISASLDFSTGEMVDGGIEGLMNHIGDGDRLYIFRFQIFYAVFEKWAIAHAIPFKSNIVNDVAKVYTGHTKRNPYIAPLIIGDAPELEDSKTPVCKKFRIGWQGKEISFIDISQWIRDTPVFAAPISFEYGQECQKVIEFIIERMLPKAYKGEGKASIASLSRSLFNFPRFITKDDGTEHNTKRIQYLDLITPSYAGGLYYLSGHYVHYSIEKVYCFDMRSAYPSQLYARRFPNFFHPGEIVQGLEFDDDQHVHFYHIRKLKASLKARHFPTLFTHEKYSKYWASNNGKTGRKTLINLSVDDEWGECIITSVDYRMLLRDYDIEEIAIDFSVRCGTIQGRDYFETLIDFYHKKEAEPKESIARTVYKVMIDSFSGSLAMRMAEASYMFESLDGGKGVKREISTSRSPIDIASFMTAYQRWEISEHALRAGFENVISIDTDSVFTYGDNDYLESVCHDSGLGTMHIDKEMYWAKWFGQKQYVGLLPDGKHEIHITGLPAFLYKDGESQFVEKMPLLDKKEKLYYIQECGFTLNTGTKKRKARRLRREEKKETPADEFLGEMLKDR